MYPRKDEDFSVACPQPIYSRNEPNSNSTTVVILFITLIIIGSVGMFLTQYNVIDPIIKYFNSPQPPLSPTPLSSPPP